MLVRNVIADALEGVSSKATVDALKQSKSVALNQVLMNSRLRCFLAALDALGD